MFGLEFGQRIGDWHRNNEANKLGLKLAKQVFVDGVITEGQVELIFQQMIEVNGKDPATVELIRQRYGFYRYCWQETCSDEFYGPIEITFEQYRKMTARSAT
jgi:hypothetical protein